jgi:NAD(P)-dependent dehydrogenase (short-subunit alcohol dehydrogenase family)
VLQSLVHPDNSANGIAFSRMNILITGVSSGFGRAIAVEAMARGHTVIGTARSDAAREQFLALDRQRAHARTLDVTQFDAIPAVVADIESSVGSVDALVNNAGYGHEGILEESPIDEMRRQFDVNVFGAVAMIKAVLPYMRQRRRGRIVNITSMGGFITMPGIAYYCGSKFALEGISEVLGKEVQAFGIAVTAVAPGSFRTDWAGRSMVRSPRSISDYDALFEPIRGRRRQNSGRQLGDPARAARAIVSLLERDDPPPQLLLGSDAVALVREKLRAMERRIAEWEAVSLSTDAPQP